MEQKTALYDRHVQAGAKMVDFAGFLLPVQYTGGVLAEHRAVRESVGLFDVSHMGELWVEGKDALPNLDALMTNNIDVMQEGGCRYSPMCNEKGGVVDDVVLYRMGEDRFMLVVNAANRHKDAEWLRAHLVRDANLLDRSDQTAQLALQGPLARQTLEKLAPPQALPQKYYTFCEGVDVGGVACLVSRTGYTGEKGFELYCKSQDAPALWDALMDAGSALGIQPCGLGARDTLRLEAALPLYGHEMDEQISPLEAGLSHFVKLDKEHFIGKNALLQGGKPHRLRTGLRMTGRGIAREGMGLYAEDRQVGVVTSGTMLPTVGYAGALALLAAGFREAGTALEVDVRGRRVGAQVVPLPFYKRI